MANEVSCLPASTFIKTIVNINDELVQEDLFLGFNILSDVLQDQIVGSDPFGLNTDQPCSIRRYNSFQQVASDFRENSETYIAAFNAFSVNDGGNALFISNFPMCNMEVTQVENTLNIINRQNRNWSFVVLAKRAFYDEQVGLTPDDTYTAFQLAISMWVEDRREQNCESKFFFGQTDDHRALLPTPYDLGLDQNFIYDAFLAEYNYTMAFYHNTFLDTTETENTLSMYRKIDSFQDAMRQIPNYTMDSMGNPIFFQFLDVIFAVTNLSRDLNEVNSGYTAKFQTLDFVTPSSPRVSQGNPNNPNQFLGNWDSQAFIDTGAAINNIMNNTLNDLDVRTHMQILTGYLPRSQSLTPNFGYLGEADVTSEAAQFGRYGNVYLCHCDTGAIIEGTVASGRFWDVIHATDWISHEIELAICELWRTSNKIPLNGQGLSTVTATILSVLQTAQDADLIDEDLNDGSLAFAVSEPAITDITPLDRRNRRFPCYNVAYRLSQALHSVCVQQEATIFTTQ